jgi:CRP-like cAMP-binding protein
MSNRDVSQLRRIPLFSGIDDAGLERIADLATEFEVPAGRVLIEPGQAGTGLFVIQEGSVRVDLPDGSHTELGEGEFFGEVAVVADTTRTARVSASSDLRGLAIRRGDLMDLLESNGSMAVNILRKLGLMYADLVESHS